LPLSGVNPFDAEDPDVALLKIGDKLADGIRAEIYGGQIERDVLTGKKALGMSQTGVERRQPVHDRRLGSDSEGHVRTRPKHQRMAFANDVRHDAPSPSSMIPIG
jgi:hypothetical protein